jgi:hypothetical protein
MKSADKGVKMVIVHVNSDVHDNVVIEEGESWDMFQGCLVIRDAADKMIAMFNHWVGVEKK